MSFEFLLHFYFYLSLFMVGPSSPLLATQRERIDVLDNAYKELNASLGDVYKEFVDIRKAESIAETALYKAVASLTVVMTDVRTYAGV